MVLITRNCQRVVISLCVVLGTCAVARAQTVDSSFNPGANQTINALAVQPDGKILVGGSFTALGGGTGTTPRNHIGRLNADGTVDTSFDPGANSIVHAIAVQSDGKILIGGLFTSVGGGTGLTSLRSYIARLNADGTVDTAFNPGANLTVYAIVVQPDGKILVGGEFGKMGGGGLGTTNRSRLARLNPDGTLDSFDPGVSKQPVGASAIVYTMALQEDGKVVVGGYFDGLGGGTGATTRNHIGRINDDGTLDTGFNPGANSISGVNVLAIQADGKILVGGSFTGLGGGTGATPRSNIGRLNFDGSVDTGFNPGAEAQVLTLGVQADGKILAGGYFKWLGDAGGSFRFTRNYIGRLNASGSVDTGFNPGAQNVVIAVALQSNGAVLATGIFSALGGGTGLSTPRSFIGRITNTDPAIQSLTINPFRTALTWARSGTAPEVSRVTFEFSPTGSSYTLLGSGQRVPGGSWQLTGLPPSLLISSFVRARGYYGTGLNTGSGSIVESILSPPVVGAVSASPASLRFSAVKAGAALTAVTPGQTVTVAFTGGSGGWTAAANQPWVQITNGSGGGAGTFTASIINPNNILGGSTSLSATITVSAPTTVNGSVAIPVTLIIDQSGDTSSVPFGQVDTPTQSAAGVVGGIGVTGWSLDNVGVSSVKIYRTCLPFDAPASCQVILGNNVVFTGDATFVAGVRPDVEAAFASFPQAYRAGWGFLLLTNMLPHVTNGLAYGGQGPLTLYVFATDAEGNVTLLGRSTGDHVPTSITMANDTIAKPFGAIDTPGQGATVSGTLANFGWVLTPDSNTVADASDILMHVNGATINVFIDGVLAGPVSYNNCRGSVGNPVPAGVFCNDDVSNIFGNPTPQPTFTTRTANVTKYRNLDVGRGAIAAFSLDTTALTNGLHSIAWGVSDSAGRGEGIGSRYFIVLNAGADQLQTSDFERQTAEGPDARQSSLDEPAGAPAVVRSSAASLAALVSATGTIWGRTGFDLATALTPLSADADGVRHIGIPELGRLEVSLGGVDERGGGSSAFAEVSADRRGLGGGGSSQSRGFLVANGTLRDLPAGSHLDPATGVFTWAPGPGYLGTYRLTFVRGAQQIPIDVTIRPAGTVDPTQGEVRMFIDAPASDQTANGPVTIAGWALDPQAAIDSGIDGMHVWAIARDRGSDPARREPGLTPSTPSPVFLGAATLGGPRPDVAGAYGAQFNRTGYSFTTSALAPGDYDIVVYVHSARTGRWEDARTVRVTVH